MVALCVLRCFGRGWTFVYIPCMHACMHACDRPVNLSPISPPRVAHAHHVAATLRGTCFNGGRTGLQQLGALKPDAGHHRRAVRLRKGVVPPCSTQRCACLPAPPAEAPATIAAASTASTASTADGAAAKGG
eukprot:365605-Chlamydomonas_euryale.AAC.7